MTERIGRMEEKRKKKRIWKHFKALLLYLFLHNALFLVVLITICDFATSLALKASKYSYLTLQNLFPFLMSPVTLLLIMIILVIASLFFYVEVITLSIYNQMRNTVEVIRITQFVIVGFEEAIRLLKIKKNYLLPLFSMLSCIFYALPLYIGMMFRQRIPSYIFDSMIKKRYTVPIIIIILVIITAICYIGMFSFFYISFDRCDFITAYRKSKKTIHEHRKSIAFQFIKYNILLFLFYVVLYCFVVIVSGIITFFMVDDKLTTAAFLTTYDHINRYYAIIVGVFGIIINLSIIYRMFLKYKNTTNSMPKEILIRQSEILHDRKYKRYFTIICIFIFFIFILTFTVRFRESLLRQKAPIFGQYITAHRGYSSIAPENTLASIQASIDAMADYVEVDVQETKDGVVVLLHDSNLKRTTGVNKNIWSVTYEELLGYNAAKRFTDYEEISIPTLEEALLLCQNSIFMNIEIKITNHENQLVEKVVTLIEQHDMEDQCVISSTNYGALKRVKEANEDIKTGYILPFAFGYFYHREYADFFSVKSSFITPDMVELAHSVGKGVHAWTVNDFSEVERMKQLGVDNIITDYPIRIREIVYEDELTTSFIEFLRTLTR